MKTRAKKVYSIKPILSLSSNIWEFIRNQTENTMRYEDTTSIKSPDLDSTLNKTMMTVALTEPRFLSMQS
jgi:hypothetical protein